MNFRFSRSPPKFWLFPKFETAPSHKINQILMCQFIFKVEVKDNKGIKNISLCGRC